MSLELLLVISQKAFIIFSRIDTCVFNSFKMEHIEHICHII